jgi:spermidine synthase
MNRGSRTLFILITACFLISGAAGLIYQVAWSRYLALFLGHTSYAVVAVLVAFMGGLALGNAWFGARVDRSGNPLALYAWLEIAIGIYAMVFPSYFKFCHGAFLAVARSLQPGATGLLAMKFLFSGLTILPPTILMGATLPVLTRFVTRSLAELRGRVAALYGINSLGAVVGCIIADFWWIPSQGLEVTVFGAAGLNLLVGLVAFVLSLRLQQTPLPPTDSKIVEAAAEVYSPGELRLAVLGIGLSGFVAMLYEVAWTRLLALVLGSSTHAFSLMLITFITGIAVGAWIVYLWKNPRHTLMAFGWAELGLAISLLASIFFYQYLPFWFIRLAGLLVRSEQAYPLYEFLQAAICFGVMFVPTVCLGMTLPLVSRIATVELSHTGRSVGTVFAVNTFGTVLGAVVTGFLLLPALGLARTFVLGIALNAMIGLAAVSWNRLSDRTWRLALPFISGVVILWFAGARLEPSWQRSFSLGLWRSARPPATLAEFQETARAVPLRYHKDGAGSTVDVYAWQKEGGEELTLKVNGKADAGTSTDMITQLLLGHVPMLLQPQARQALVIGLGSGMTCAAIARHPTVERIDAVEISPEVVEAARLFGAFNDGILTNPKLRLALEDAKSFLQITERKYDLIVSEPSNPWMAGVAAVFSREYYETCAARLNPGGLMAQWMHVYETTDETVNMVLRTFLSVFPYLSIWQPTAGDLILIGARQPQRPDLELMRERFAEHAVRSDFARVGLLNLPTVLAREIVPQEDGFFLVPTEGPVQSDFFPQLEYLAQRGFFLNRVANGWRQARQDFSPRAGTLLGIYLRKHPLTEGDFRAFVTDHQQHGWPESLLFRSLLLRWQAASNGLAFPVSLWATASENIPAAELRALRLAPLRPSIVQEAATNPESLRVYAWDLMETYRAQRSIFYLPPSAELESVLQRLIETDSPHQRLYRLHLAELAWDRGDDARCLELGQSGLDPDLAKGVIDFSQDPSAPRAVIYRMAETLWRASRPKEAWEVCQAARASGYLDGSDALFPVLEVTYRRIEAAVGPESK